MRGRQRRRRGTSWLKGEEEETMRYGGVWKWQGKEEEERRG